VLQTRRPEPTRRALMPDDASGVPRRGKQWRGPWHERAGCGRPAGHRGATHAANAFMRPGPAIGPEPMTSDGDRARWTNAPAIPPAGCGMTRVRKVHDVISEVHMSCANVDLGATMGSSSVRHTRTGPGLWRFVAALGQSIRCNANDGTGASPVGHIGPTRTESCEGLPTSRSVPQSGRPGSRAPAFSQSLVDRAARLLAHHVARLVHDRGLRQLFVIHAIATYPDETNP